MKDIWQDIIEIMQQIPVPPWASYRGKYILRASPFVAKGELIKIPPTSILEYGVIFMDAETLITVRSLLSKDVMMPPTDNEIAAMVACYIDQHHGVKT